MKVTLFNSSSLLLKGIFALSSLHLQGVSKSRAYQSQLITILKERITRTDAESVLENLVATMLLYQYEVCEIP
jgi:hypothetical protein